MKRMKIGFDAKRAAQNLTGLGNYSRFVIHILNGDDAIEKMSLYTPNPKKLRAIRGTERLKKVEMVYPTSWWAKCLRMAWRVWGLNKDINGRGIELFHGLSNELPLNIGKANCKSVVTIHDLIFLHYPQYYKPIDRWIYCYKFRKACENADRVVAVSECTKRDIVRFFGIEEEKVDVVYQGCHEQFSRVVSEEEKARVRKEYGLPDDYILYLGSIEERKNLLLLAQALKYLPKDQHVVAVGKNTPYAEMVRDYLKAEGLSERFHFRSGLPFDTLPAVYQSARVFVYPSRYEGFGIPMLEALCCGVPAIGAKGSCLEEAGGRGSLYVSPDDERELAEAISRVMTEGELRERMIGEGKEYAKRFRAECLRKDLLEVYRKTLEG